MLRCFILLLLVSSLSYAQDNEFELNVIGGEKVEGDRWNSVVALNACTGVLIDEYTLLTAAHCLVKENFPNNKTVEIYWGNRKRQKYKYRIAHTEKHPLASSQYANYDIAVVILAYPIKKDLNFFPIVKSSEELKILAPVNSSARVIGFGRTKNSRREKNKLKKYADITIRRYVSDLIQMNDLGVDSCNGDSGGPVFVSSNGKWHLAATVVGGSKKCGTNEPAYYHAIANSIDWIEQLQNTYISQ